MAEAETEPTQTSATGLKTFLKNYTSNVPASRSIYEIEQVLIRCGVTGIMKEYDPSGSGNIFAITFQIKVSEETPAYTVRLPADKKKALEALWEDYAGDDLLPDGKLKWTTNKRRKKASFEEQAERTAWRIVKDWVAVQMSMIQMKQADTLQVFMPYLWDGKQTFYQIANERGLKNLLAEKCT